MIGGKVIGIVRVPERPTLINVGGAGDEIFAAAALLGEEAVACDEPGCVRVGDEVWWDEARVYWTPRVNADDTPLTAEAVEILGDTPFPRRA